VNNTLEDKMCPAVGDATTQTDQWLSVFAPPILDRLNTGAPGANLTEHDVYSLMSLCPFDTVAKRSLSPFCDMFDKREFEKFEYRGDLDKYYGRGLVCFFTPENGDF
jgi:hypothetical protein